MVRPILKDINCLVECEEVTGADRIGISNLQETYRTCRDKHNYLSANMIGDNKRMFIITYKMIDFTFINPRIIKAEGEYEIGQQCLYHKALRTAKRYKKIEVEFENSNFEKRTMVLEDEFAANFLHMMDHINGKRL